MTFYYFYTNIQKFPPSFALKQASVENLENLKNRVVSTIDNSIMLTRNAKIFLYSCTKWFNRSVRAPL